MKKVELVEAIAEAAGLTKDANRALDATIEAITKALKKETEFLVDLEHSQFQKSS